VVDGVETRAGGRNSMKVGPVARPVALVTATALLLSPGLWLGPPLDSAVFLLAGIRIRAGYMPYKDLWDHKPPGTYLMNAVSQMAIPWLDPWLLYWLLTLAFTGFAILVIDRLLRRSLSPVASFLWSLVCLVGIAAHPVALGGGATESFALLPLVVVLLLIVRGRPTWQLSVWIGMLLSIACLMSLQAAPAAIVLFAVTLLVETAGNRLEVLRRSVAAVAGGSILPLVIAGWLMAGGAAGDAIDQIVTYNAAYRESSDGITTLLPAVALFLCCLAIPVVIQVAHMLAHPRAFDRVWWVCVAWAVGYSIYLGYQGRLYLHYMILLVPPLVILAGPGMAWIVARLRTPKVKHRYLAVGLSVASSVAFATSGLTAVELTGMTLSRTSEAGASSDVVAAWLETNTAASARVFIWGDDTALYLNSHRTPYDRYVYQFPLVTAGYWSPDRTRKLLSNWAASPPDVIVEIPSPVPMFATSDDTGADPRSYDTLQPLRDFVRSHYVLAATLGDDAVYLRDGEIRAP
jgi:hypothetical protein